MSSDPFKAAVPMLRSAVEAEKRASGGDAKAAEEAAQLYITALALLDEAAGMEGKYPPKVLSIIGQKADDQLPPACAVVAEMRAHTGAWHKSAFIAAIFTHQRPALEPRPRAALLRAPRQRLPPQVEVPQPARRHEHLAGALRQALVRHVAVLVHGEDVLVPGQVHRAVLVEDRLARTLPVPRQPTNTDLVSKRYLLSEEKGTDVAWVIASVKMIAEPFGTVTDRPYGGMSSAALITASSPLSGN